MTAGRGKTLRRISDGNIAGKEVYLGMAYWIDGKKLDNPVAEQSEDYEEIDEPVVTEDSPFVAEPGEVIAEAEVEASSAIPEECVSGDELCTEATDAVVEGAYDKKRYEKITITAADFIEMKQKVDRLFEQIEAMNGDKQ